MSSSDVPPAVRAECVERAGYWCECCGWPRPGLAYHLHHRLGRDGARTDNRPVNLMVVIPSHHDVAAGSIHQEVARSIDLGHIVQVGVDPADVPVVLLQRRP